MSARVVLGAQWGDEGKGKIVDMLSKDADFVIRYQGGANAGHTLKFDDKEVVLHLVPSGIFNGDAICVIGNGVVVDLEALKSELDEVRSMGVNLDGRFFISNAAHVILPYHKTVDKAKELHRGAAAIGTTGRGIGPAYKDKVGRVGIRMMDLYDKEALTEKVRFNVIDANATLRGFGQEPNIDAEQIINDTITIAELIKPFVTNAIELVHKGLSEGKQMLLEGAQGCLLDLDYGTYPFVTSSSPTSGGACTGSGLPPTAISKVMGIAKAYTTRVGNGPFPTELFDPIGEKLRKEGFEFGATTGRPRRCGWLDLVALRYAVMINGINELTITKMDILDSFDEIKVCTEYEINGERTKVFPLDAKTLDQVTPIYKSFKGWKSITRGSTDYSEIPAEAKTYLDYIQEVIGVKLKILSTGPGRKETIVMY